MSVGLAKNRLLWCIAKTVPPPLLAGNTKVLLFLILLLRELGQVPGSKSRGVQGPCYDWVLLKSISQLVHTTSDSCSFPTWTLVPGALSTHGSAGTAQDCLPALQTWRTQSLPGGFPLLMDPRRTVDFFSLFRFLLASRTERRLLSSLHANQKPEPPFLATSLSFTCHTAVTIFAYFIGFLDTFFTSYCFLISKSRIYLKICIFFLVIPCSNHSRSPLFFLQYPFL